MKETAEEVEKTNEEVFRDREYQVRCTVLWVVGGVYSSSSASSSSSLY